MRITLVGFLALTACGSVSGSSPDAGPDAAADVDAAPPAPIISDALACGSPGTAGGLGAGTELVRADVDLTAFPDALCNDGSGAVFYFRPAADVANRNRWVIQLQGGGSCKTPDECAARWCSVDTNFGMLGMTSNLAPVVGINGNGILDRRAENPLGPWNQVFIKYCSSDDWSGTAREQTIDAVDPDTGVAEPMRIHFLGGKILDAVIATLRQDGASVALPDLDDATQVVLAGASAGGAAMINNADRVASTLRTTDPDVQFGTLVDSAFPPSLANLDPSYQADIEGSTAPELWAQRGDQSCIDWHALHEPETAWECRDLGHVIRNHVTTPMFVRMSQADELIMANFVDSGWLDAAGFAQRVRADLTSLSDPAHAEEGAAMVIAPGGFSPTCVKHETLSDNASTFTVTIDGLHMFEVIANWLTGATPALAITTASSVESCPP